MDAGKQIDNLLEADGATLVRNRKHQVWRLSNGKIFVRSNSPSDRKSNLAHLADLRRALQIEDERGKPGERRERVYRPKNGTPKNGAHYDDRPRLNTALSDQLRLIGVIEDRLRGDVEILEAQVGFYRQEIDQLMRENDELTAMLLSLESARCSCWVCALKRLVAHLF